jgi:hypothetical protein
LIFGGFSFLFIWSVELVYRPLDDLIDMLAVLTPSWQIAVDVCSRLGQSAR